MKNIILFATAFFLIANIAVSQTLNWASRAPGQNQIASFQTGLDYGITFGLSYGRYFNLGIPVLASAEYGFPAGKNLTDDFKIRVGAQAEVLKIDNFSLVLKVYAPMRRFENSRVQIFNFGAEVSGAVGYYRRRFFVAGEFGFDKAVTSRIKHSALAVESYPLIKNGWYIPNGGNYNYGLQTGFSFRKNDISLRVGKLVSQGFETIPFLPFYGQLGYVRRF